MFRDREAMKMLKAPMNQFTKRQDYLARNKKKDKVYNLNSESESSVDSQDMERSRSPESYRKDLPYDFSQLEKETLNLMKGNDFNKNLYPRFDDPNLGTLVIDEAKDHDTSSSVNDKSSYKPSESSKSDAIVPN